ncbi:MAG: transglutaminase-like domain-containing protein [Candidatus Firestonebacteria bacterium]
MKSKKLFILLCAFLILGKVLTFSLVDSWAVNQNGEEWANIFMGGMKVGYAHSVTTEVIKENQKSYTKDSEMLIKMARFGSKFEAKYTVNSVLDADLSPISFLAKSTLGDSQRNLEGKKEGNVLKVTLDFAGEVTKRDIDLTAGLVLEENINDIMKTKALKTGDKYKLKVFIKELMKVEDAEVLIKEKSTLILNGISVPVYVLETSMLGFVSTDYLSEDKESLKSESIQMSLSIVKTNKEDALNFTETSDIAFAFSIDSNYVFQNPFLVKYVRAKISGDTPDIDIFSKDNNMQTVELNKNENTAIVTVKSFSEPISKTSFPVKDEKFKKYLAPTTYEQCNDKEIVNLAKKIIGQEKNTFKAVVLIKEWVYKNLKKTALITNWSSAKEVLVSRKGDCKAHAILMSTLVKAVGIPAKICAGIVPSGKNFMYHMWTSVYVGKWVSMDPTFNQNFADATHIEIASGVMDEEGIVKIAKNLVLSLGKITVEVLEWR